MIEDCTAVILAGGQSRRMGEDKASLLLHGETLLTRAIHNLQPLFENIIISVRKKREGVALPQICDAGEERGPIIGIAAALEQAKTDWIFVLAVDMPFPSGRLIQFMAGKRKESVIIVPEEDKRFQPLFAFYAKSCLPVMQQHISNGERSLQYLIGKLDALIINADQLTSYDPGLKSFIDLDSQEEVADLAYMKKQKELRSSVTPCH